MAHRFKHRIVDLVGEDHKSHARSVGPPLPAYLLVQTVLHRQIAIAQ